MNVRNVPDALASFRTTLFGMLRDESGDALVEYCIVMATLTALMMIAYRNVGSVANNSVGNNANSMTNSSVVAP